MVVESSGYNRDPEDLQPPAATPRCIAAVPRPSAVSYTVTFASDLKQKYDLRRFKNIARKNTIVK